MSPSVPAARASLALALLACHGDWYESCEDHFGFGPTIELFSRYCEALDDCRSPERCTTTTGTDTGYYLPICVSSCDDAWECVQADWGCDTTTGYPALPPICGTFTRCIEAEN